MVNAAIMAVTLVVTVEIIVFVVVRVITFLVVYLVRRGYVCCVGVHGQEEMWIVLFIIVVVFDVKKVLVICKDK